MDLRSDLGPQSPYSRLRDLRAEARADERTADNEAVSDSRIPVSWASVDALATDALSLQTKDLEIAAWLAEALVRRRGLSGLDMASRAIAGLVEQFWDRGLFPSPDPDDPEGRVFAVTGLSGSERDGSLLQPLRKVVLFETADGNPVALWQYQRSQSVAALNEKARKQQHEQAGVIPFDMLEAAARTVGQAALLALGGAVLGARSAWTAMERAFESVAGADTPSTGRISAVLAELDQIVRRYVSEDKLSPATEAVVVPTEDGEMPESAQDQAEPGVVKTRKAMPTREELLDDVLAIAVQFRKNEPNSPLSYTLEEAVRRARLPLPDLLREIIPELSVRSGVLTLLGIRPADEQK